MDITLKKARADQMAAGALIVLILEDDGSSLTDRAELAPYADLICRRIDSGDFEPKPNRSLVLFLHPGGPERLILVGLGKADSCRYDTIRAAAAKGVRAARDHKVETAALLPPPPGLLTGVEALEAAAVGALLGQYDFDELKTEATEKTKRLSSLCLIHEGSKPPAGWKKAVDAANVTARAVTMARDLINRPANLVYPEVLAETARTIAKERGLKATILGMEDAEKRKMGSFLGVAQGSRRPGRIIVLEYQGGSKGKPPLALVGKAITFDSGGLSLKTPESMVTMKTDMSGGAAVLAVMEAAAVLKLPVNLVGIVPATENMPDGGAYRPGDVLTSMSGLTIEVISTDAEGRMILADALTLAQEYKPAAIIDLATLTGACVVALGEKCAGLMTTSDDLAKSLQAAAQASGERVWPLPLFDDYNELIKSDVADMKNSGGRNAGATVGGLFLKKFVSDQIPWAHVDIAGPARNDKAQPDAPVGGVGFGVQLLLKYLRNQ
jgi:leucyl aminopeptidase